MSSDTDPTGAHTGGARHSGQPAVTKEYFPSTGGYEATYVESDGEPGEKDIAGSLTSDQSVGDSRDFGVYANPLAQRGKDDSLEPASFDDPECGGPPLGSTVGPNGGVDSFAKSKIGGGGEPNEPGRGKDKSAY